MGLSSGLCIRGRQTSNQKRHHAKGFLERVGQRDLNLTADDPLAALRTVMAADGLESFRRREGKPQTSEAALDSALRPWGRPNQEKPTGNPRCSDIEEWRSIPFSPAARARKRAGAKRKETRWTGHDVERHRPRLENLIPDRRAMLAGTSAADAKAGENGGGVEACVTLPLGGEPEGNGEVELEKKKSPGARELKTGGRRG